MMNALYFEAKKKMTLCFILFLGIITSVQGEQLSAMSPDKMKDQSEVTNKKDNYCAYLFVYFTGNRKDEEQIRFALSDDGYNYKALNNNQPVISFKAISLTG
ncbi:MAG: hypothetical protein ACYC25_08890, partial [Paludibacter sp.]